MNTYLKEAKKLLALSEPLLFVIGNESCDLDSAVSAISLAYYHSNAGHSISTYRNKYRLLPLLNIPRVNLPLKTEVTHFLTQNSIELDNVICSDEVSASKLQLSKVILVDHHIATASVNVHNIEEVIDHRPVTKTLPPNARCIIDDVGSCATLIANIILQAECSNECTDVLKFLHGPIVLDTVNFSVAADKTRPLDIAVNERIERALGLDISNRNRLFNELVKARNTVASLNSLQILSKDLKIISNEAETVTVAIPGFPISVQEYMRYTDVDSSLRQFAEKHNAHVILLMGMQIGDDGSVQRDIGVIPIKSVDLASHISNKLHESGQCDLQLTPFDAQTTLTGCKFYNQSNIRMSRKQILPIVQSILE